MEFPSWERWGSALFRDLFLILFQPRKTLDRLLEERKFGQSWGATWFLVGIHALFTFFVGLYLFRFLTLLLRFDPMAGEFPEGLLILLFAVGMVVALLSLIVYFVGGRFLFSWLVILGLRISASAAYPQDPEERRERARLLRLIHPYTSWITLLPSLIGIGLFLLLFDYNLLLDAFDPFTGEFYDDSPVWMTLMGWFFGFLFVWMIQSAFKIYMVVVRTMGIKRIYSLNNSQAFWGPFLVYFLLYFVYYLVYFGLMFLSALFPDANFNMI